MDKNISDEATSQNTYEIKGSMNLLRGDLASYAKQLGLLLISILVVLVYLAVKLS